MIPEYQKRLTVSYPNLYRAAIQKDVYFPFECGDGWFNLIDELSAKLESMIIPFVEDPDIDLDLIPCASQVKEKWGMLRFYMSSSTPEMDEAIEEAEDRSATICEVCGDPGTLYESGWCKVRCNECLNDPDRIRTDALS